MTTINCPHCGQEIELTEALTKDFKKTVLEAEHQKHLGELAKVRADAIEVAKKEAASIIDLAKKQSAREVQLVKNEAKAELEIAKKMFESDTSAKYKKSVADQEATIKELRLEASSERQSNKELREQISGIMKNLREERKSRENLELEMQKKLIEGESKSREEALKIADEKYRLKLAESDKKLADTQKALDEAQRKAAQGSQQLQGEILELEIESVFSKAFHDDEIKPVAKGEKGGDILHFVKSPRGILCGVMLWEIKRTKNWADGWITTIKNNVVSAKANIPIIITNAMPKEISEDLGNFNGVWVCKPHLAVILAALLRKGLLDVGREKALAQNRGTKADALFSFVTSHEFVQQIESMVSTYLEMTAQVGKERFAFEKLWSQREKQAERLLNGTANIVGSIQELVGQASMPRIRGLDLLESGEEAKSL